MAELTVDQLLDLIEKNGGPQGLDLRGKDLSGLDLGREAILRKLKELLYTSLEPEEFQKQWEQIGGWKGMREGDYVKGDCPPWLSPRTLGLDLMEANLSPDTSGKHTNLRRANLQHADLWGAKLQHAYLWRAELQHADLGGAELQHAELRWAELHHADLGGVKLQHANLWGAKLQHASLAGVEGLEEAHLEGVDWSQGHVLGEEDEGAWETAEAVYRRLKQWYSRNGQYDHAGEFHFREMECRRKLGRGQLPSLLRRWLSERRQKGWWKVWKGWGEVVDWLWVRVFRVSCGYGERPLWTLGWLGFSLVVPALFYGLFSPLTGWQGLYYSAASLVAFINPLEVEIPRWLDTVALAQAYAGYFLMALFLVVLVLKMGHR